MILMKEEAHTIGFKKQTERENTDRLTVFQSKYI